jgi:light-regulated signal transduction histidine kinase (bacteriophytochrome)
MIRTVSFADIFAVMAASSVGDRAARVQLPEDPDLDDTATRLAIALNILLDDLAHQARELEEGRFRANSELEAFSYSVAHDLRAPLRAMNGYAHLLIEEHGDKLAGDGVHFLQKIHQNANRMAELIDGLLALSRVSRAEIEPKRVDLSLLVHEALVQLAIAEPSRAIELDIQEGIDADLDPRLARVLITNLVANAWKFTSKTDGAKIELGMSPDGGVVFLRDNGAGFDMEFANKMFVPFQRLHAVSEFPGAGIGLATVQRIVHRHNGTIWATGEVGCGATFFLAFPRNATFAP